MTDRKLFAGVLGVVSVAWPLLVWLSVGHVGPRWVALALVALAGLRAWATREVFWLAGACGALVLALFSAVGDEWGPLKLYPALVNAVLLAVFATSLRHGPPAVERLARIREPDLPPAAVVYTRRVTQVWCGFFLLNGTIAAATVAWGTDAQWALYNGVVAYALMGALMAGEWLVRRQVRGRIAARVGAQP